MRLSSGRDAAAEVRGTSVLDALGLEVVVGPERHAPGDVARVCVHGRQFAPRWHGTRMAIKIDEAPICAVVAIRHRRARAGRNKLTGLPLAWHFTLRHGTLFDSPDRLSSHPVENV